MPILRLDHIAVLVRRLDDVLPLYRDHLGLKVEHEESIPELQVRVVKVSTGNTTIELVEPMPGEASLNKYLEKRGEGLHHLCFEVDNVATATRELSARGLRPVWPAPHRGAGGRLVNFLTPKEAHGVLIELSQRAGAP
ncbi:MAG: methylmalonyl-CoA epimerase [Planctomycetes bacterium]|nr:methylmalonyl-CoA epimerase [Planctomycetota bacterium]